MADVRFIHSSAGYTSLMKSGAMRDVFHGYAGEIEGSANASIAPDSFTPPLDRKPYQSYDFTTSERAGVRIQTNNPHARLAERKHGHLQNAAGV